MATRRDTILKENLLFCQISLKKSFEIFDMNYTGFTIT